MSGARLRSGDSGAARARFLQMCRAGAGNEDLVLWRNRRPHMHEESAGANSAVRCPCWVCSNAAPRHAAKRAGNVAKLGARRAPRRREHRLRGPPPLPARARSRKHRWPSCGRVARAWPSCGRVMRARLPGALSRWGQERGRSVLRLGAGRGGAERETLQVAPPSAAGRVSKLRPWRLRAHATTARSSREQGGEHRQGRRRHRRERKRARQLLDVLVHVHRGGGQIGEGPGRRLAAALRLRR